MLCYRRSETAAITPSISIKHAYPVLASYLITGFCIAVHDTPPWPFFSHTIPHLVCHPVRSSLRFYVAPLTTDQNESCIDFDCYLSLIKAATPRSPFTNSQCDFKLSSVLYSIIALREFFRSLSSFIPPVLNITPPLLAPWHNRDVPLGFQVYTTSISSLPPSKPFPRR